MHKQPYIILLPLFFHVVVSCNSKLELEADFIFVRSQGMEYFVDGDNQIQLVKSSYSNGEEMITDTTVIVQTFKFEKLIEQVEYRLDQGDSIVWRRLIYKYSDNNELVSEVDSIDGRLWSKSSFNYENGREIRAEHFRLMYQQDFVNNKFEVVSIDTMRSVLLSTYDSLGNCLLSKSMSRDNMLNGPVDGMFTDTTYNFHKYDGKGNRIKSVAIYDGDTTSVSHSEYNDSNKLTKMIQITKGVITSVILREYNEFGNMASEVVTFEGIPERTEFEYDNKKRIVSSLTYKSKETSYEK